MIRRKFKVYECHSNRAPDINQVNVVAKISEIVSRPNLEHLDKLVECRINDSCKQDQRVGVVIRAIWVFLNSCLQIDQVGVEEQDDDVDEVDAAAKQVERECKLVPLERDAVLQSLALEHVDLFALSAQVHEVDVIVSHV